MRAAVRNAALELNVAKRRYATGEKSKDFTTTTRRGDCFCSTASNRRELKGRAIAAAKLHDRKMTEAHKQLLSFQLNIADLSVKLTADMNKAYWHIRMKLRLLQKLNISQQDLQHQNV